MQCLFFSAALDESFLLSYGRHCLLQPNLYDLSWVYVIFGVCFILVSKILVNQTPEVALLDLYKHLWPRTLIYL